MKKPDPKRTEKPRRSKPIVADQLGGVDQKELSIIATVSNRAQLDALTRISEEVKASNAELKGIALEVKGIRTWVIAAVILGAVSVLIGTIALFRGEALERRVQRLEEILIHR